VPITAKLRAGMYAGDESYIELGRRLQDVGVGALGIHGRHAAQHFAGTVDLGSIERLVRAVSIPVLGSGDVFTVSDVLRMLDLGCGGVMIARGALGRTWLFRQAAEALAMGLGPNDLLTASIMPDPPWRERLGMALCHAQMLALHDNEQNAMHEMRGHVRWYTHGMPGGGSLRGQINHVQTLDELADVFLRWAAPEVDSEW
jgi:tRNA-dihydrouridine synthase